MADFTKLNGYTVKDPNAIHTYDTVADLKADTKLKAGNHVQTKGYTTAGDGGHATYIIVDDNTLVDDGGMIHNLTNGLKAVLNVGDFITPEMYGAFGDGVHDDTIAMQSAIDFAESHQLKLISSGDKVYKINETLNVDNLICNLNGATITSEEHIDLITINSTNYYGKISGIKLDCTHARSGIYIQQGRKKTITDVVVDNVNEYGIYYSSGYENLINDCHINGLITSETSCGIYMQGSDSKVSNVILINCKTAIDNYGMNFYEYIHAWISESNLIPESVMVKSTGNNTSYYIQCYSDTYETTFYIQTGSVQVDQLKVFFNQSFYLEEFNNPTLIKYADGASMRSSIVNSNISGVRGTQKINFSNKVGYTKVNNNNLNWVTDATYYGGLIYEPTATSANITQVITNKCVVKNGVMYINLLFVIDTTQGGAFTFSNIPTEFRPQAHINTNCNYGDTQWVQTGNGYLFISDKVSGSVSTTGNATKYVKIVQSYPIANENY